MAAEAGLSSGDPAIVEAVKTYFESTFAATPIALSSKISTQLKWSPSLAYKFNGRITLVEASELPYPRIFRLRRAEILGISEPISVYAACPEESFLKNELQSEISELTEHGYGLLSINDTGAVTRRADCIPLVQLIAKEEFSDLTKGLPKNIRQRLLESYEQYNHLPPSGVGLITELVEGMILRAGRDFVRKGWLSKSKVKPGNNADTLDAMLTTTEGKKITAEIGGARGYIHEHRNLSHHFPKDPKQAHKKYRVCRHAFIEGINRVQHFREGLRKIGVSGQI